MKTSAIGSCRAKCALIALLVSLAAATANGQQIIQSGETILDSLSYPGAMRSYQFYADSGNGAVIAAATQQSYTWDLNPEVRLYTPAGALLDTAWGYSKAIVDSLTLSETGWYVFVVMDYEGSHTGAVNVSLALPGRAPLGDVPLGLNMTRQIDPDMESFAFYGQAGTGVVVAAATGESYTWDLNPELRLYTPSGLREASAWGYSKAVIDSLTLSESGWYVFAVTDLEGSETGVINVSLALPGAASNGDIVSGQAATVEIDPDMESFTFYGESGDGVVITASTNQSYTWDLNPELALCSPSGIREASDWGYSHAIIDNHNIAETGWYTIAITDHEGNETGEIDLSFARIPPDSAPIMNPTPAFGDTVGTGGSELGWHAPGGAASYDLYLGDTFPLPLVAENLTQPEYVLPDLESSTRYFWRVIVESDVGEEIPGCYWWFATDSSEVVAEEGGLDSALPGFPRLLQVSPNPVSTRVDILYELGPSLQEVEGRVTVKVFDSLGRLVATPVDRSAFTGARAIPWDLRSTRGELVAPGVYFVKMETDGPAARDARRLVVVR